MGVKQAFQGCRSGNTVDEEDEQAAANETDKHAIGDDDSPFVIVLRELRGDGPHGTKKEKLTLKVMVLTSSQAARPAVLRWSGGANEASPRHRRS